MQEPTVLVFDLETDSLNTFEADIKVAGVWSNKTDKIEYIWYDEIKKFKKLVRSADFIVTFNGTYYDLPVMLNQVNKLFRYESTLKRKHIDLRLIVKDKTIMFGVPFENGFSLDAICNTLGMGRKVKDFDLTLLQQDSFNAEDRKEIERYLKQDIVLTRDLYLYCEELFSPFKEFLPEHQIKKKQYITSSTGTLAYKIICHMSGEVERYADRSRYGEKIDHDDFKGGDVLGPYALEADGNVRCVDYTSMYPHCYMQANLYTHCTNCTEGKCQFRYTGGTTPDGKVLKLFGAYCTLDGMGRKEMAIKRLFFLRAKAKGLAKTGETAAIRQANQSMQAAIKSIIVTIYGISGSELFETVYDIDTAQDCTKIGRFEVNYMHYRLGEAGYKVLYGDTDSAYILDPFKDDTRIDELLDAIIADLKTIFPFPQDTFGIDREDSIAYIKFFQTEKPGVFKKKTYVYLRDDGKVVAKGLQIIKSNSSKLSKHVWDTKIIDFIREEHKLELSRSMVEEWIEEAVTENRDLVAVEFNVRKPSDYEHPNQLHARIAQELGEGKHLLVKNKMGLGIGSGVKYLPIEQAVDLDISQLDLSSTWSELSPFIANPQQTFDVFEVE